MGKKIVPAELRDNMTEQVGALEMKSPTYKFKKNMLTLWECLIMLLNEVERLSY